MSHFFRRSPAWTVAACAVMALGGCAQSSGSGKGDPGPNALPEGKTCQSIRGELNQLDAKGVPAKIEASQAGKKLAPGQQAEVDQYNLLLNQYLGARCHVAPS